MNEPIIGGGRVWLDQPAPSYLMQWEQAGFDAAVDDVFGYYALQIGRPELDCLRANRIVCRMQSGTAAAPAERSHPYVRIERLEELPFESQSLDLVALPHGLELAEDPHEVLRECERILRPEGRLVLSGLNPISLWGARALLPGSLEAALAQRPRHLIAAPRLRDWLKLLGFEPERAQYGCYRPPCASQAWLDRTAFLERAGDRWWPICGAVYLLSAVKRVRAMRLVGPAWKRPAVGRAAAPAAVASTGLSADARTRALRAGRGQPETLLSGTCNRAPAAED